MAITSVTVLGDRNVTTTTSVVVAIPSNGWMLQVVTDTGAATCDPTQIAINVSSPGYSAAGTTTTVARVIKGRYEERRPYPDQALKSGGSAGTFNVTLTGQIYAGDTITSIVVGAAFVAGSTLTTFLTGAVVRNDSKPYPKAIPQWITRPYARMGAAGLIVEASVGHAHARNGQQVAGVRFGATVGANSSTVDANAMVQSQETPTGGTPSNLVWPCYRGTIPQGAMTDGAGTLWLIAYPYIGDSSAVWDSRTDGVTWPTANHPTGLPFRLDTANNFAPAYAWINRDGTGLAGTSTAGLSTALTSDPGAALSYIGFAAAAAAIKLFNASSAGVTTRDGATQKRTTLHSDIAGGVIMLRDDASGDYTTTVAWNAPATYTPGDVPLEIRRAVGGAATASASYPVRIGSTGALGLAWPSRTIMRGIQVNARAATGTAHIIIDYTSAGGPITQPTASAVVTGEWIDCWVVGNDLELSASPPLYRSGYRYDVRTVIQDCHQNGVFNNSSGINSSINLSIGGGYQNCAQAYISIHAVAVFFSNRPDGGGTAVSWFGQTDLSLAQENLDGIIVGHTRTDAVFDAGNTHPAIYMNNTTKRPTTKGGWLEGNLIRISAPAPWLPSTAYLVGQKVSNNATPRIYVCTVAGTSAASGGPTVTTGTTTDGTVTWTHNLLASQPVALQIGSDNGYTPYKNVIVRNNTAIGGRSNVNYNERGAAQIIRESVLQGNVFYQVNMKRDTFTDDNASTGGFGVYGSAAAVPTWVASTAFASASYVQNAGAFYQSFRDVPASAIAITDLTYWEPMPAGATLVGPRPRRTGSWRSALGVESWGNVFEIASAGGDTAYSTTSWLGEAGNDTLNAGVGLFGDGTVGNAAAGGDTASHWAESITLANSGSYLPGVYVPKLNGTLASKALFATMPFDMLGVARRGDGTGYAGALEGIIAALLASGSLSMMGYGR